MYELHPDGYNSTFRLCYSGDIEYFGKEHLSYAILAIITSTVFVIIPVTVLTLYPFAFFQKFLNCIPVRWHIFHTFIDSFQGVYKDGTEPGTRDCRWFAALLFFVRILVFIISAASLNNIMINSLLLVILFLVLVLLIVNVQPFKAPVAHYSKINATFFSLFIFWLITICGMEVVGIVKLKQFIPVFYALLIFFSIVPLIYTLLVILYWIYSHSKLRIFLTRKIQSHRRGYNLINGSGVDLLDSDTHARIHHSSGSLATSHNKGINLQCACFDRHPSSN